MPGTVIEYDFSSEVKTSLAASQKRKKREAQWPHWKAGGRGEAEALEGPGHGWVLLRITKQTSVRVGGGFTSVLSTLDSNLFAGGRNGPQKCRIAHSRGVVAHVSLKSPSAAAVSGCRDWGGEGRGEERQQGRSCVKKWKVDQQGLGLCKELGILVYRLCPLR